MPPLVTSLRAKPAGVPSLAYGTLWPDTVNKKLFLYGGLFTNANPTPFDLWMYDTLYDTWAVVNQTTQVSRIWGGASAVVQSLGRGYYLGGYIGKESEYGWEGDDVAVSGLLMYDMVANVWTNETLPNNQKRAEGVLIYVPVGDNGILVSFGGITVNGDGMGNVTGIPMDQISIYDISSSKWYQQTATGDIPGSRRLFCAGVANGNVTENGTLSTHNIYLYGGASTSQGPGYDDVYVLSLPNFVWTRFWPTTNDESNPHNSLSCSVISNAQMLIIGGSFPNPMGCDAPDQAGVHNLNLSGSNPESTVWRAFQVGDDDYEVPSAVVDNLQIQGGSPVIDFSDPDLPTIFSRTPPASSRTPTRAVDISNKSISTKDRNILIGVLVPVGVIIIAFAVFCGIRARRKRREPTAEAPNPPPTGLGGGGGDRDTSNYKYEVKHPLIVDDTPQTGSRTQLPEAPLLPEPYSDSASLRNSTFSPPPPTFSPPPPSVPTEPVAYIRNPVTGGLVPVYDHIESGAGQGSPDPRMDSSGRTLSFSGSFTTANTAQGVVHEIGSPNTIPRREVTRETSTTRRAKAMGPSGLHELDSGI
ncbi:hypothetical protein AA313_de0206952 [Arthrobotrys entomopaga]|nr:hypothetical protein AA313_de0206952 [Arthrobotrys entomopaga]